MFQLKLVTGAEESGYVFKVVNNYADLYALLDLDTLYVHELKPHPLNPCCVMVKRREAYGNVEAHSSTGISEVDVYDFECQVNILALLEKAHIINPEPDTGKWLVNPDVIASTILKKEVKADIAKLLANYLNETQLEILCLILENSANGWRSVRANELKEPIWKLLEDNQYIKTITATNAVVSKKAIFLADLDFLSELRLSPIEKQHILSKLQQKQVVLDDFTTLDPMTMTLFDNNVKVITGSKNVKNYKIRLGTTILSFVPKDEIQLNTLLQAVYLEFSRIQKLQLESDLQGIHVVLSAYSSEIISSLLEQKLDIKDAILHSIIAILLENAHKYCFIQEGQINLGPKYENSPTFLDYDEFYQSIFFKFDKTTGKLKEEDIVYRPYTPLPPQPADATSEAKHSWLDLGETIVPGEEFMKITMFLKSDGYLLPDGPNLLQEFFARFRLELGRMIHMAILEKEKYELRMDADRKAREATFHNELLNFIGASGQDIFEDLVKAGEKLKKHFPLEELKIYFKDAELREYIQAVYEDKLKNTTGFEILKNPLLSKVKDAAYEKYNLNMTAFPEDNIEFYIKFSQEMDQENQEIVLELISAIKQCLSKSIMALQNIRDLTTMLYNKTYFNKVRKAWYDEYSKHNISNLSEIMFDLDRLKFTNDFLGHKTGDDLIGWVSKTILKVLKTFNRMKNPKNPSAEECLGFKWGGDEFSVLAKNLKNSEFEILAKDIFRAITETPVLLNFYISKAYSGKDNEFTIDLIGFLYNLMTKDIGRTVEKYADAGAVNLNEHINSYLDVLKREPNAGKSIIRALKAQIINLVPPRFVESKNIKYASLKNLFTALFSDPAPDLEPVKVFIQEEIFMYMKDHNETILLKKMPKRRLLINSFLKVLAQEKRDDNSNPLLLIRDEVKKVVSQLGMTSTEYLETDLIDLLDKLFAQKNRNLVEIQEKIRKQIISTMQDFMLKRMNFRFDLKKSILPKIIELFLDYHLDNISSTPALREALTQDLDLEVFSENIFVSISGGTASAREDSTYSADSLLTKADSRAFTAKRRRNTMILGGKNILKANSPI